MGLVMIIRHVCHKINVIVLKINSAISAQPLTTGPATASSTGFITKNPIMVCLYQAGDSPRKLCHKAPSGDELMMRYPFYALLDEALAQLLDQTAQTSLTGCATLHRNDTHGYTTAHAIWFLCSMPHLSRLRTVNKRSGR